MPGAGTDHEVSFLIAGRAAGRFALILTVNDRGCEKAGGMLLALPVTVIPSPTPAAACAVADPAITALSSQLVKKRGGIDHYVITATLSNIGDQSQTPDITQRVELVRDGTVLAPQPVPALGQGVAYKVAFAVDRPTTERSQPLTVTVRYVLETGDPQRNACNRSNDALTKTF